MLQSGKHPDLRVIKTKKAIRTSFSELLTEKDLDSITVKDIADRALINRKTIYNYYRGVYQIVEEIENELISDLAATAHELEARGCAADTYLVFHGLCSMINRNAGFYSPLFHLCESSALALKLRQQIRDSLHRLLAENTDIPEGKLGASVDFAVSGVIAVYRSRCASGGAPDFDGLPETVGRLCCSGLSAFIGDRRSEH